MHDHILNDDTSIKMVISITILSNIELLSLQI